MLFFQFVNSNQNWSGNEKMEQTMVNNADFLHSLYYLHFLSIDLIEFGSFLLVAWEAVMVLEAAAARNSSVTYVHSS